MFFAFAQRYLCPFEFGDVASDAPSPYQHPVLDYRNLRPEEVLGVACLVESSKFNRPALPASSNRGSKRLQPSLVQRGYQISEVLPDHLLWSGETRVACMCQVALRYVSVLQKPLQDLFRRQVHGNGLFQLEAPHSFVAVRDEIPVPLLALT